MATYKINFPRLGTVDLVNKWQKGKKGNDFRYEVSNGKETFLLWLGDHPVRGTKLEFIDVEYCKKISPTHMKNKNYNYYLVGALTEQEFDDLINEYEGSNPMVPVSQTSMMHSDYANVNYKLIEKI